MSDHLFPIRLFESATVNATASIESAPIDLRFLDRIESIRIRAASVTGAADVKVEYATGHLPKSAFDSPRHGKDEAASAVFGSFDDEADIEDSTGGLTSPEGWHSLPFPDVPVEFIKIKVTGVGTNPADTVVDAHLVAREVA